MAELKVKYIPIGDVKPYGKNPRKNAGAVKYVANSLREFGWRQPIVIDSGGVIVAGHTRLLAAQQLGMETVPVVVADDLTPEQIKAYRLADNKTAEFAEWDADLLDMELDDLDDIDMSLFGFELSDGGAKENPYTGKVQIPQYEVQGENVEVDDLCDDRKQQELVEEIISTPGLTDEEREFLVKASMRHLVFDYRNIAEYYAKASIPAQRLMEKSALVIIDYADAIANGYVKVSKRLREIANA